MEEFDVSFSDSLSVLSDQSIDFKGDIKVEPDSNPKPSDSNLTASKEAVAKPKRKYRSRARAKSPNTVARCKRLRRAKANDRERNRMHSLNGALERLRCTLPSLPDDSKLTKIETLKMAYNYIATLTELVKMPDNELQQMAESPESTTPPKLHQQDLYPCSEFQYPTGSPEGYSPSPGVLPTVGQEAQELYPFQGAHTAGYYPEGAHMYQGMHPGQQIGMTATGGFSCGEAFQDSWQVGAYARYQC